MQTRFSTAQLADPDNRDSEKELRRCVHCGFCTATCPTYVLLGDELDSPRGRIYLIKDLLENERAPDAAVVVHIDRCLSCLACVTTCPSGVNYQRLIDHARSYIERNYRRPWRERWLRATLAHVLPYPRRLAAALRMAQLTRVVLLPLARATGLRSLSAMLELLPSTSRGAPRRRELSAAPAGKDAMRVAVLKGCAEPVIRPQIRAATLRLLARMGVTVAEVPGESCCGALVHHLGRADQARAQARINVDRWSSELESRGLAAIVATASGCGTMLKDYAHVLANEPRYAERAARLAACSYDVSELIAARGLPPLVRRPALRVAYQAPCSLQHGQALRVSPRQLLTDAGFEVLEPDEAHLCCGSAGTYNLLQPQLAAALRTRKIEKLEALAPDVIASGNIGCITQLQVATAVPIVHTVELLDWATGGPAPSQLPAQRRPS